MFSTIHDSTMPWPYTRQQWTDHPSYSIAREKRKRKEKKKERKEKRKEKNQLIKQVEIQCTVTDMIIGHTVITSCKTSLVYQHIPFTFPHINKHIANFISHQIQTHWPFRQVQPVSISFQKQGTIYFWFNKKHILTHV